MKAMPASERVKKHREFLRASGLRPIQIWVPDTRNPEFAKECYRQCLIVKNSPEEVEINDWLEKVSDTEGWV